MIKIGVSGDVWRKSDDTAHWQVRHNYYRLQTKLGDSNVFIRICLFTSGVGGDLPSHNAIGRHTP